jgi:outer membrane protein
MSPRLLICSLFIALSTLSVSEGIAQSGRNVPVIRVGTIVDGPWNRNQAILAQFQNEILALTQREFDVQFPESKQITADFTMTGVRSGLDQLLGDGDVDLVLALGPIASHDVSLRGPLPKPVVAPFVIDPGLQGLPESSGTSGVKNLSYLTIPTTMKRDVNVFLDVVPFTRLSILANKYLVESIPGLEERLSSEMENPDVIPTFVRVEDSGADALASLPEDTEAVYLFPLVQLSESDYQGLIDGLNARGIPTFSYMGEEDVRKGVLAGLNPDLFPRLTRRVGLNVQQILLGTDPGTIPYAFSAGERLFINLETANLIGKFPGWGVITEAELIGDSGPPADRFYTLQTVMVDAVAVNLDLLAAGHFLEAGAQEVKIARSPILPQLNLGAVGSIIDPDRGSSSFGVFGAEQTLSGSATLSQVVIADPTFANYSIQKHLQDSRIAGWDELRLDIGQQSGGAYLNVLRAGTLEEIQRENLRLSRTNLELARVRVSIGQSPPSDIYRWESEIATSRRDAIFANASRNVSEIELNRVLNRPLEEPFDLEPMLVDDAALLLDDYPYLVYFGDKLSFHAFRDFLVQEGMAWSPEIQGIDAGLEAVGRSVTTASREWWLPKIGVFGSVNHVFSRGGENSTPPPEFDFDTTWEVGAQAEYPLFNGLGRVAENKRTREERARLEVERQSTVQRIDQRIRSSTHRAGASFAGIEQSLRASEAAFNNLDLVTDSYSRGTVSIIELIDAQNAYIVADESAANAVYDFLIDIIEVQRAIGRYDHMMSDEERAGFNNRLTQFMDSRGIQPRLPR